MIRETIVVTRNADASAHVAPMGVHERGEHLVVAPFRPSRTLENLRREGCATVSHTDDVRVFAGCLSGRRDWPVCAAETIDGLRLAACLAHAEVEVTRTEHDPIRPRFVCRVLHEQTHAPFRGFNRAQAAVVEAAILVSRLERLPWHQVERDLDYLRIAVGKTAGPDEQLAWDWLMAVVDEHRARLRDPARRERCA